MGAKFKIGCDVQISVNGPKWREAEVVFGRPKSSLRRMYKQSFSVQREYRELVLLPVIHSLSDGSLLLLCRGSPQILPEP